jgi:GAF domain-containing protein
MARGNEQMTQMLDDTVAALRRTVAELEQKLDESRAERDEAQERETATSEVLQVINSSPGDLAPVFDAMLEKAMRLCEAAFGGLWTEDNRRFRATALRGVPALFAEFHSKPLDPVPGTGAYPLLAGENFVHIPDLANDEGYRSGNPAKRVLYGLGGARTVLFVALRKEAKLLGIFMIYRQEVRPYTDKQIALLQSFAAQAVIAMENARLITETREALEQQTATAEVLQVINSSPGDLAPVFDAMLDKALRLCDGVQGGLWLRAGARFRLAASAGLSAKFVSILRQYEDPDGPTLPAMQRVLQGERVVQYADLFCP